MLFLSLLELEKPTHSLGLVLGKCWLFSKAQPPRSTTNDKIQKNVLTDIHKAHKAYAYVQ